MGTESATVEGIQPVPTVNVNEAIQDRLKQFILEKKLAAGDRLPPEGRLAGSLGVSRPALREALRALEALGTLEVKVGSGWYVRAFSFDSVTKGLAYNLELSQYTFADLSQIRVGLECGFIEDAMRSLTPDTLRNLEQIVTAMEEAAEAGEGYLYTEKDRRFHQTLFADVENPLLDKLMEIFWTLYDYLCPEASPERGLVADARKHRLILDAIVAGNTDLARQRLRESVEESTLYTVDLSRAGIESA